jgi:hypothetical protein
VRFRAPVSPRRDGGYDLRLDPGERAVVAQLCADLRTLVERDDPATARLFPKGHRDDPEAAEEYDRLVREGLVDGRLAALATVLGTVDAERLDEEQAGAWCGALNDLRLVLGERLGVTEDLDYGALDRDDPRAPDLALYGWLTWLQGHVVDALASRL